MSYTVFVNKIFSTENKLILTLGVDGKWYPGPDVTAEEVAAVPAQIKYLAASNTHTELRN